MLHPAILALLVFLAFLAGFGIGYSICAIRLLMKEGY